MKTPVAMIVYNRLDLVEKTFEQIRKAQPDKLYIISDGPKDNAIDIEKVQKVRNFLDNNIDWDCYVYKNYSERNLGVRVRPASGISWVFETAESAIILEDDCYPSNTFFEFCEELLNKYANDENVMMISGTNHYDEKYNMKEDYVFSYFSVINGWATWKRAWTHYDINIKNWDRIKKDKGLRELFTQNAWLNIYSTAEAAQYDWYSGWDIQWDIARYINRGLGIVPKINMVKNLGFNRDDSSHTSGDGGYAYNHLEANEMEFPICHNKKVERNNEYDLVFQNNTFHKANRILIFKQNLFAIVKKRFPSSILNGYRKLKSVLGR